MLLTALTLLLGVAAEVSDPAVLAGLVLATLLAGVVGTVADSSPTAAVPGQVLARRSRVWRGHGIRVLDLSRAGRHRPRAPGAPCPVGA